MPVWITGIGPATPLGNEYAVVADHLLAGVSGVRSITAFETAEHPSRIAATVETTHARKV